MATKIEDTTELEGEIIASYISQQKSYKVLLISQNSADIYLINKLLDELGSFEVIEAKTLSVAFEVVGHTMFNLIIVDDVLSTIKGYDIISRLEKNRMLNSVPKVMLLTQNYKQSGFDNHSLNNIDFIKRPIDGMIFKTRVHSIIKNAENDPKSGSLFEIIIEKKINEAKEFLKIYKSFLDIDENIIFVYDKEKNRVLETNKNFNSFFTSVSDCNRVIQSSRLMQKFIPTLEDTNYLNAHHSSTWLDFIIGVEDFNFLLTIKRKSDFFTFNTYANKIKLFNKDIYIVKLSNHNIYTSRTVQQVKYDNKNISQDLEKIKKTINNLSDPEDKRVFKQNLVAILDKLNLDSSIVDNKFEVKESDSVNIYFVIASLLKQKLDSIDATLNSEVVDENFMPDCEIINVDISPDAVHLLVEGIIDFYHDCDSLSVDIKLFIINNILKIEIVTVDQCKSTIKSVFDFNPTNGDRDKNSSVPKNMQNALIELDADIRTYLNEKQNIFLISIPIK